jgi:cell envelope opacity-associated protein A
VADKKNSGRSKADKPRAAVAKSARARSKSIVESSAPAPQGDEDAAAAPQAPPAVETSQQGAQQAAEQQQTTISTSRGFVDFLATNCLSLALTSYQTGN